MQSKYAIRTGVVPPSRDERGAPTASGHRSPLLSAAGRSTYPDGPADPTRPFEVRMTFSTETLSLLVLVALGLGLLALLLSAMSQGRRRPEQKGPIHMDDVLRGVLEGQQKQLQRLEAAVRSLNATDRRQEGLIEGAVRRVGLVRYDAFEDVGGRLSFSCALLDDHGSGVVVTSINGRQDTRVYAKPIADGTSSYNLSIEEEEAIRQALAGPREAVTAT
jgi:hypothetical protein